MPYALQLYVDSGTDAAVRRIWNRIAEAGSARHLVESADRPHLTLAVYDDLDVVMAARALRLFAQPLAPFPVAFAHVGVFLHPAAIVFLAPVVTTHLLELHRATHERFAGIGNGGHPYYLPGRWVPHCTVALHLAPQAVPLALEVAREFPLPMAGIVTEMGIVRVNPTAPLGAVRLGGSG